MAKIKTETYLDIEYKGRLFGDVLREIVYATAKNTYDFVTITGITSVSLSNFMNHKRYPGIVTIRKIAKFLPESERNDFITYYINPQTKKQSIEILKNDGINDAYSMYGTRNTEKNPSDFYQLTDSLQLEKLQLQGLFKYLSPEEKKIFKDRIITYVIERNKLMQEALKEIG